MADFPMLRAQAPIVLRDGRPTPEFYGYLLGLDRALGTDYAAQFTALAARVAALEEGGALTLRGIGSITVRNGVVQLLADEDNLAGNSYYGANAAGERGFWPVVDALAAGIGLTKVAQAPWNVLGELDDPSQLPASASDDDAYLIDGDYWVWQTSEWSNEGPPSNSATLGLYPGAAENDALLWDPIAGDYVPAPAVRNPMTTAGDLIVGGVGGEPERLGIGAEGQVITVQSGVPVWKTPSGGGGGGGWGFSPPSASDLPIVVGSVAPIATDDADVGLILQSNGTGSGDATRARVVALADPTANWTVVARVKGVLTGANYHRFGLVVTNAALTKAWHFAFDARRVLYYGAFNLPAGYTGTEIQFGIASCPTDLWFRLRRIGSAVNMDYSADGKSWLNFASPNPTAHFGSVDGIANVGVGFGLNGANSLAMSVPYWDVF